MPPVSGPLAIVGNVDLAVLKPDLVVEKDHPMTGRRALVVGINYAPEPTGIAPYTTGMAAHLGRHARSVHVLTGVPHYPSWEVPAPYRWRLRVREGAGLVGPGQPQRNAGGGVSIRRVRHYVPRRQTAITRAAYEGTFLLNAMTTPVPHPPDLVIAVTPALGGAVAAGRIAKRFGAPLIVVVQDLMAKSADQSGIHGGGRVTALTARVEAAALRQADRIAIVSEAFRAPLHEYGIEDGRISVLPNWTHISPTTVSRDEARRDLGWPAEPFTVVHTGNIGLKQDLGNLVDAARLCRDQDGLRFVIVGDGSQRQEVQARAADLPNVSFVDPLDDVAYPKALAAADLLVVNERPSVGDMSLPSKLTSYFTAGRPVLAAVSIDGATARELDTTGGAAMRIAPGDPTGMAMAVLELRDDERRRAAMGEAGRVYAETALAGEAAMARLDALIESVMPV